jgi:hypothetical protein
MKFILSLFSKETIIKAAAFLLHAITPAAWDAAKFAVLKAEQKGGTSAEKFETAKESLSELGKELVPIATKWLIETALGYAQKELFKRLQA